MRNIDDIFRDNLYEGDSFETKKEHWNDMEALLDEEKRKKRGLWFFRTSALILSLALISFLGFYFNTNQSDEIFYRDGFNTQLNKSDEYNISMVNAYKETLIQKGDYLNMEEAPDQLEEKSKLTNAKVQPLIQPDMDHSENPDETPYEKSQDVYAERLNEGGLNDFFEERTEPLSIEVDGMKSISTIELTHSLDLSPKAKYGSSFYEEKTIESVDSVFADCNNKLFFRPFIGGLNISKRLEGINGDYIARRSGEEFNKSSLNYGFQFGLNFGQWMFSTGLESIDLGEQISYSDHLYERQVHHDRIWDHQVNYKVDTIYYYGIRNYDTTDVVYVSTYTDHFDTSLVKVDTNLSNFNTNSSIRFMEIPLTAGYRFKLFNGFSVLPEMGLALGVPYSLNATYINQDQSGFEVLDKSSVKSYVSYRASINLEYRLAKQWNVDVQFRYSANMTNAVQAADFNQKYQTIGANIGLTYSICR
ncbi:MAG: porin family protein [Flavobacteriales bacterium]|nr:porin family protein [Flavobacteriales bacterium]